MDENEMRRWHDRPTPRPTGLRRSLVGQRVVNPVEHARRAVAGTRTLSRHAREHLAPLVAVAEAVAGLGPTTSGMFASVAGYHPLPSTREAVEDQVAEDAALEAVVVATQQQITRLQALQAAAMAQLARKEHRIARPAVVHELGYVDQLSAVALDVALGVGSVSADRKVHEAARLAREFPSTLASSADGHVDDTRTRRLLRATTGLPTEVCRQIDTLLAPDLPGMDPARIAKTVRQLVDTLAPEEVRERDRDARRGATVEVTPGPDGMTDWFARLPSADSAQMWASITALAAQHRKDDPELPLDRARARAFVDLLLRDVAVDATVTLGVPIITPDHPDHPALAADAVDSGRALDEHEARQPTPDEELSTPSPHLDADRLEAEWALLLSRLQDHQDHQPCDPDHDHPHDDNHDHKRQSPGPRHGTCRSGDRSTESPMTTLPPATPPTPATAMTTPRPATPSAGADAVVDPPAECVIPPALDEDELCRTTRDLLRPRISAVDLGSVGVITADTMSALIATTGIRVTRALLTADAGCLVETRTDAYRPPGAMKTFVTTRDQTCRWFGCTRKAITTADAAGAGGTGARRAADLDHVTPHPEGATTPANLLTLCRRHHRAKQMTGFQVHLDLDAEATFGSPTGLARGTRTQTTEMTRTRRALQDFADRHGLDLSDPGPERPPF